MSRSILVRFFVPVLTLGLAACEIDPSAGPQERAGFDAAAYRTWHEYQGDGGRNQYSSLDQINRENVQGLQQAWIYHTGDPRPDWSQIQCNPIVVDGVLYATSPQLKAFALDAATGAPRWTFDPFAGSGHDDRSGVNRGVVYWADGDDRRILYTAGATLYALDAATGRPVPTFGDSGRVDLRAGLGRDVEGLGITSNTPGALYEDLVILGTRVGEGPGRAAPGHIRAYNVRTGEMAWVFHTIPQPGEFGYDTWPPDAWERIGGANSWSGITVDRERGVVYVPTGSAAFDFWGGNRHGANLFANSIIALDATTGERIWHYQFVHHDIWDRDLPAPPNLVTVEHEGRRIEALAQITKSGHVFLLDRDTGEPLFPVEERPYPASDLRDEATWPTQPLPTKPPPFSRQVFREEDATDLSPESNTYVRNRLRELRSDGQFVPPSTEGTIIFPGFDGGGEWGGAAYDPASGLLYVNANEMPWILTMVDVEATRQGEAPSPGEQVYAVHCAVCHGADRSGGPQNAYPPLLDLEGRLTRDSVLQVIAGGRGLMPQFGFLSPQEQGALLGFLFGQTGLAEQQVPPPDIPYSHTGYNRFFAPDGYPAVKPPWGTLNAIDLDAGTIAWQVPLGEFPELTARGIPPTGAENYGGPVVTAGGLLFIGATKDEKFRAFDKETGRELWETDLPAGGYATPATYEVDGKQYVVIAAGGGKMGTPSGDAYVAFALPD